MNPDAGHFMSFYTLMGNLRGKWPVEGHFSFWGLGIYHPPRCAPGQPVLHVLQSVQLWKEIPFTEPPTHQFGAGIWIPDIPLNSNTLQTIESDLWLRNVWVPSTDYVMSHVTNYMFYISKYEKKLDKQSLKNDLKTLKVKMDLKRYAPKNIM